MILALSIVAGVITAAFLFRIFFDGFQDFSECIGYWLTPDIISLFRGEWGEDQWAEMKLFLYVAASAAVGALTYFSLLKHFG